MDVRELRIGNYVDGIKYINSEMVVSSIGYQSMPGEDNLYLINSYPAYGFKPIPLTEEWLLRFGFTGNKGYMRKDNDYSMHFEYVNDGWECNVCFGSYCEDSESLEHIKYVHQLQNLYYALTGKELI